MGSPGQRVFLCSRLWGVAFAQLSTCLENFDLFSSILALFQRACRISGYLCSGLWSWPRLKTLVIASMGIIPSFDQQDTTIIIIVFPSCYTLDNRRAIA